MLMTHRFSLHFLLTLLLLGCGLLLSGCDLVGGEDGEPVLQTTGVIVGSSGNFTEQNGTIAIYDPETRQTQTAANLDAFLQVLTVQDDSLYAVTNTFSAGRVEVLSASGTRHNQAISPSTPRAIAVANAGKAYVPNTSFSGGDSFVAIYDRTTGQFRSGTIPLTGKPEDVLVTGGQAFVADYGASGAGTALSVIDVAADQVTRTIDLGCDGPNELFLDDESEIAVVCAGKTIYNDEFTEIVEQTNGQVVFVSPSTGTVVDRIRLDQQVGSANFTQAAYYAAASEELYVIDGTDTVLRFDTDANALRDTLAVPADPSLTGLTAVAYDVSTERLYLGRFAQGANGGPDYTAAGSVVVLNRAGAVERSFAVGPAPAHIVLRQEPQ